MVMIKGPYQDRQRRQSQSCKSPPSGEQHTIERCFSQGLERLVPHIWYSKPWELHQRVSPPNIWLRKPMALKSKGPKVHRKQRFLS